MTLKHLYFTTSGLYFNSLYYGNLPGNTSINTFSGCGSILSMQFQKGAVLGSGTLLVGTSSSGVYNLNLQELDIVSNTKSPVIQSSLVKDIT